MSNTTDPIEAANCQELLDRLKAACSGWPHANIAWPHRLLHDSIAEIEALRAQVAAHDTLMTRMASNCDAEVRRAAAALADCQAVVRARGHAKDCPGRRCSFDGFNGKCWVSRAFHETHKLGHEYQSPPCACGHDRALGVTP